MVESCPSPRSIPLFVIRGGIDRADLALGTRTESGRIINRPARPPQLVLCQEFHFAGNESPLRSPLPMIMVIDISANSRATEKGNGISAEESRRVIRRRHPLILFAKSKLQSRARNSTMVEESTREKIRPRFPSFSKKRSSSSVQ